MSQLKRATGSAFFGRAARIIVDYRRASATARNVVISIAGTGRTRPPVVVTTPRSSWWQSTAERGGGLVCWLECLRALLSVPPAADVVMTANSGHELAILAWMISWRAAPDGSAMRCGSIGVPTLVPRAVA
jgi:hypothetical protein